MMKADAPTGDALEEQLASVTANVGSVLDALVEIARGIHPAILSQGGLAPALRALARRSAVPVELHAQIEDPLLDEVEAAAYYVAAEALTNTAKHARLCRAHGCDGRRRDPDADGARRRRRRGRSGRRLRPRRFCKTESRRSAARSRSTARREVARASSPHSRPRRSHNRRSRPSSARRKSRGHPRGRPEERTKAVGSASTTGAGQLALCRLD
jgi:hypothetical protein